MNTKLAILLISAAAIFANGAIASEKEMHALLEEKRQELDQHLFNHNKDISERFETFDSEAQAVIERGSILDIQKAVIDSMKRCMNTDRSFVECLQIIESKDPLNTNPPLPTRLREPVKKAFNETIQELKQSQQQTAQ